MFLLIVCIFLGNTEWRIKTEKISHSIKNDRTNNKRTCNSSYDYSNKRTKNEPKENNRSLNSSSELLQQLISNNNNQRQKTKGKGNNWLLNSNGKTAACVSQPSDSVLMNLLVSGFDIRAGYICLTPTAKSKS